MLEAGIIVAWTHPCRHAVAIVARRLDVVPMGECVARVSVIIPTYNRGDYVEQAIGSVLRQCYQDLEVVVVDDGSTDDTAARVRKCSGPVRYVRTENRGPAHARNVGMKLASGEYLCFLDSDDLYYPFKVGVQARLLDLFPDTAMVSSELSGFDDEGFWEESHLQTYHAPAYRRGGLTYETIYENRIRLSELGLEAPGKPDALAYFGNIFDSYFNFTVVSTNTMMIRRGILGTVGYQDEGYRLLEDHHFALRIARNYKVAFIDVPLYKLRYHGNQISDVTRGSSRTDGLDIVIEKQRNFLRTVTELGREDAAYYAGHRRMVDRRIASVQAALALPLMCTPGGAAEARNLLLRAGRLRPIAFLLALSTALPVRGRRAVVKAYRMLKGS